MLNIKRCYYCGCKLSRKNHTLDHIKPKCRGGKDKKWNKVDACNQCNQDKGCLTIDEFRAVMAYRSDPDDPVFKFFQFAGEKK